MELILLYWYSQELSHILGILNFVPVLTWGRHFSLSWAIQIQSTHSLPSYFLKAILILSSTIRTQQIRIINPAVPVVIPLPRLQSLFEFRPWKPDEDWVTHLHSLIHSPGKSVITAYRYAAASVYIYSICISEPLNTTWRLSVDMESKNVSDGKVKGDRTSWEIHAYRTTSGASALTLPTDFRVNANFWWIPIANSDKPAWLGKP